MILLFIFSRGKIITEVNGVKKILLHIVLIINLFLNIMFIYASSMNIIYANSKTVGISLLGLNITAEGISPTLQLLNIIFISSSIFLIIKIRKLKLNLKKI